MFALELDAASERLIQDLQLWGKYIFHFINSNVKVQQF